SSHSISMWCCCAILLRKWSTNTPFPRSCLHAPSTSRWMNQLNNSPEAPVRAVIVAIDFGIPDFQARCDEFKMLAESAGADVVETIIARRARPDAALFVGSGKAEEIALTAAAHGAELILVDHALSPAQQRNLERVLKLRVVDRVSLILDIFALRARSHEGKLQVELAQLQHLVTRLTRMWSHLERQRGGIGKRGPGDSQLETQRRTSGDKVRQVS